MKFLISGNPQNLGYRIDIERKKMNLDYYIYLPEQKRDVINIGIMRLGHAGGYFFKGKIVKENSHYYLLGDFIEDTFETRGYKHSKWPVIIFISFVLWLVAMIVGLPLYFIIDGPWWTSVLSAIGVCLLLVIVYLVNAHVKHKQYTHKLKTDKQKAREIFISLLVNQLSFSKLDDTQTM